MTITTTSLGDHTTQVSLNGETSLGPMIIALDAAIVSGSYWIQHDVTNQYYRVYKSLNIDGISYKYAAVSIDPMKQRLWIFTMENWDAVNHIATNEAFSTYGGYWSGFTFSNCDIVVFAGQKWLGIQTYVRSINNVSNSFVVETSREHVQDTAALGYPCWGYLQPTSTAQPAPYGTGTAAYMFAMPRTRNGYVGKNAALYSWMATPYARISGAHAAIASTGMPSNGIAAALVQNNNSWDSTNNYSYTLKVGVSGVSYQGRITAIKGTRISGATLLNRVTVPVDSDFFYSSTGTPTEHWTIPINQERLNALSSTAIATTNVVYDAVWNGDRVYYTSNGGCYRIDLTTNTVTPVGGPGNFRSICFDGRYIWALNSSTNIIRWDTTTDTVVTSAAITGMTAQRMCYDGTYLWALDLNVTGSTIVVRKIDPTTLLQVAQYSTPSIATTIRGSDIACDVFGNIAFTINDPGVIANNRVYRLFNGVITGFLVIPGIPALQYVSTISWMGSKGFDVISYYPNGVQSIQFLHVDCSATTPINLANTSLSCPPVSMPVGYGYAYYANISRQGRGVFYNDNNMVWQQDFESTNSTLDAKSLTPASLSIANGYNVGTHMINWVSGYTLYISPLPPAVNTTSATYLLPK